MIILQSIADRIALMESARLAAFGDIQGGGFTLHFDFELDDDQIVLTHTKDGVSTKVTVGVNADLSCFLK